MCTLNLHYVRSDWTRFVWGQHTLCCAQCSCIPATRDALTDTITTQAVHLLTPCVPSKRHRKDNADYNEADGRPNCIYSLLSPFKDANSMWTPGFYLHHSQINFVQTLLGWLFCPAASAAVYDQLKTHLTCWSLISFTAGCSKSSEKRSCLFVLSPETKHKRLSGKFVL